jgi:anti-sigma regulatory factor (Ser/Thr protein kinase)
VELRLPATANHVVVARQALSGVADTFGWDAAFSDDVRLALSEACTNVVQHAYRNATSPGDMVVSILIEAGRLLVAVSDDGMGIVSPSHSDGLGLGLPLMRTLSDELQLNSSDGHTEVRMAFSPTSAESAGE